MRFSYIGLKEAFGLRAMGQKRTCDAEQGRCLKKCLAIPHVSGKVVKEIWNQVAALPEKPREVTNCHLKQAQTDRIQSWENCFVLKNLKGSGEGDVPILVPKLADVLRNMCAESKAWKKVVTDLLSAAPRLRPLRVVLYHDEVTCGNVLSATKGKKLTSFYFSFQELGCYLQLESSWIPLSVCLSREVPSIEGGLSAVLSEILGQIPKEPFDLCGHRCVLQEKVLFLSDADALRASYGWKGSAGLKPCGLCGNVVYKTIDALPDPLVSIFEHDRSKFQYVADEEYFRLADRIAAMPASGRKTETEKCYGFKHTPSGLMFRPERERMPVSSVCNDSFHCYFACSGVACVELAYLLNVFKELNISREDLVDMILIADWKSGGRGHLSSATEIKRCFWSCMWEEGSFKGTGQQCWKMVFLLHYYAENLLRKRGLEIEVCDSFAALKECCGILRSLRLRRDLLTCEANLLGLAAAQARHQVAFLRAHGHDKCRPKFHHRLHLPAHCLRLKVLPCCMPQESKHRYLKGGSIVDNQEGKLGNLVSFQKSVMADFLCLMAEEADKHGLCRDGLEGKTEQPSLATENHLQDPSVKAGKDLALGPLRLSMHDVVLWDNGRVGGIIKYPLQGNDCGPVLKVKMLRHDGTYPWGTRWLTSDVESLVLLKDKHLTMPAWWHVDGKWLICLH